MFTIELVTISQACLLAFSIEYEAVRIKRIFSADLAILKPQIDVRESAKLEAMFAGMHGKADAGVLAKALQDEATREGVTLRPERW